VERRKEIGLTTDIFAAPDVPTVRVVRDRMTQAVYRHPSFRRKSKSQFRVWWCSDEACGVPLARLPLSSGNRSEGTIRHVGHDSILDVIRGKGLTL
jgi:hypothetical protein